MDAIKELLTRPTPHLEPPDPPILHATKDRYYTRDSVPIIKNLQQQLWPTQATINQQRRQAPTSPEETAHAGRRWGDRAWRDDLAKRERRPREPPPRAEDHPPTRSDEEAAAEKRWQEHIRQVAHRRVELAAEDQERKRRLDERFIWQPGVVLSARQVGPPPPRSTNYYGVLYAPATPDKPTERVGPPLGVSALPSLSTPSRNASSCARSNSRGADAGTLRVRAPNSVVDSMPPPIKRAAIVPPKRAAAAVRKNQ